MPSVSCGCCFPSFLYRVYQPTLRRAEPALALVWRCAVLARARARHSHKFATSVPANSNLYSPGSVTDQRLSGVRSCSRKFSCCAWRWPRGKRRGARRRAGDTGGRRQVFVENGSGTKSVRNGRIYFIAGVGERTDRLPHWPRSPVRPYANDGPGGVAGPSPRNRSAQQIVVIHPGQNRIEGKTHIGRPTAVEQTPIT